MSGVIQVSSSAIDDKQSQISSIDYDCNIYQKKLSYHFKNSISSLEDLKSKIIQELDLNIPNSLLYLYDNRESCDLEEEEVFDIKKKPEKIFIKVLPCENIYKGLLPPLGPPPSQPSRPSINYKHESAKLIVKEFKCLRNQKIRMIYSNLWSLLKLSKEKSLTYSNEYEIGNYVLNAIQDIIFSSDSSIKVKCKREIESSGIEPDIWLLNSSANPMGVIQFKKPFEGILENDRIHGEIFDYMIKLSEMYGQKQVFGIVSTYDKWRIYWLPNEESDRIALSDQLKKQDESFTKIEMPLKIPHEGYYNEEILKKPFQQKEFQKKTFFPPELYESHKSQQFEEETREQLQTQPLQQFQQKVIQEQQQENNFQESIEHNIPEHLYTPENFNINLSDRIVNGTEVFNCGFERLPMILLSLIKKMYYSDRKPVVKLLDHSRMYIMIIREAWYWARIPKEIKTLKYVIDIDFKSIEKAIVLLDLGGGAHGRVWMCCTLEGFVFVLKFSSEETRSELEQEARNWKKFWNFNACVQIWNDRSALMMPYLLPANEDDWNNQEFLIQVSHTITRLALNGLYHQDLRKRHVGKYLDKNKRKRIAFFDLSLCEDNRSDIKDIEISMRNSLFK